MFYVKETLNGATEVKIGITDDNVYNVCPHCGKETKVFLSDWIGDEDFDIYGSAVCCDECSEKMAKRVKRNG